MQQQFNINANYCVSVRYSYACSKITELLLYLSQCHNTADITGSEYVSGIVGGGSGTNYYSELSNIGNVSGTAHVTGVSNGTQNIELSYNTGNLYGIENVSGITNSGNITNCFNAGDIDAEVNSGGISAYANGNLHNVFNFGRVPKSNIEKCIGSIVGNAYWGVDHLDIKNVFYLTNNATPIGGPYITDANVFVEKTEAEFASGELCIALNEGQEPTPWGQNIGNNPYPLLNGEGNPELGAIEIVSPDLIQQNTVVFDLCGRQVTTPLCNLRGIYIVNGKKILINGQL